VKRPRLVLAAASVALFAAVALLAVLAAPPPWRAWLAACAGLALIAALQSVAADPRDLATALLLSLPPVLALLADAAPTWPVGPLAVLLLVASELGAMSWDCQGTTDLTPAARARLMAMAPLAGLGLLGALVVTMVGRVPVPAAGFALAGAAAVAAVGAHLLFRGRGPGGTAGSRSPTPDS
jgi:hypothetical protein